MAAVAGSLRSRIWASVHLQQARSSTTLPLTPPCPHADTQAVSWQLAGQHDICRQDPMQWNQCILSSMCCLWCSRTVLAGGRGWGPAREGGGEALALPGPQEQEGPGLLLQGGCPDAQDPAQVHGPRHTHLLCAQLALKTSLK